jgi:hypothetical protein
LSIEDSYRPAAAMYIGEKKTRFCKNNLIKIIRVDTRAAAMYNNHDNKPV